MPAGLVACLQRNNSPSWRGCPCDSGTPSCGGHDRPHIDLVGTLAGSRRPNRGEMGCLWFFNVSKASLEGTCNARIIKNNEQHCLFQRRRGREPCSQRDDETGEGRTAKATAALGTLPYAPLMPRCRTPLRNVIDTRRLNPNSRLPLAFWKGKCMLHSAIGLL